MTALTYPVSRITIVRGIKRPVIVTLIPCHGERDTLLSLRTARHRVPYVMTLADCYRLAALWHGNKERSAKSAARKEGVPWQKARRTFLASLIPPLRRRPRKKRAEK